MLGEERTSEEAKITTATVQRGLPWRTSGRRRSGAATRDDCWQSVPALRHGLLNQVARGVCDSESRSTNGGECYRGWIRVPFRSPS